MFLYMKGKNGLGVKNVALLYGGEVVGSNAHEGLAFDPPSNNLWDLNVTKNAEHRKVTVEADVRGDGGVDSNGRILVYGRGYGHFRT
jgi:hypothetical protein